MAVKHDIGGGGGTEGKRGWGGSRGVRAPPFPFPVVPGRHVADLYHVILHDGRNIIGCNLHEFKAKSISRFTVLVRIVLLSDCSIFLRDGKWEKEC